MTSKSTFAGQKNLSFFRHLLWTQLILIGFFPQASQSNPPIWYNDYYKPWLRNYEPQHPRPDELYQQMLPLVLAENSELSLTAAKAVVAIAEKESKHWQVDTLLVLAMLKVESNGNPQAISRVGAKGLMQIMPETGKFLAHQRNETWTSSAILFDIERNLAYGINYYAYLLSLFDGDERAAIAAYNWGPRHIDRRLKMGQRLPQVYLAKVRQAERVLRQATFERTQQELSRKSSARRSCRSGVLPC